MRGIGIVTQRYAVMIDGVKDEDETATQAFVLRHEPDELDSDVKIKTVASGCVVYESMPETMWSMCCSGNVPRPENVAGAARRARK